MTEVNSSTIAPKDIARFMSYVSIDPKTQAWLWTGGISSSGYGAFWHNGATIGAHRFSWLAFHGEIPERVLVCHKHEGYGRHNVNPDHLFLGSHADNMIDCAAKDRSSHGERNCKAVLTAEDAINIAKSTEKPAELSVRYGVSETIISKIKRGLMWQRETGVPIATTHNLANKSGYIGVRFKKGGWEASIGWRESDAYRSKYLGRYKDPLLAAAAYDKAALEIHGPNARLNHAR